MSRALPPLNALRALEAAGRHASFTKAADELHVTPGAVSRQIKLLEDIFGFTLFERKSGGLELTEQCRNYTQSLSQIFDHMELATKRLLNVKRSHEIHVSSSMTFTLRWLVPKMPAFHTQYPHWRLRFSAAVPPPKRTNRDDADVYIQLNDGESTDLDTEPFVPNELTPVICPRLLADGPGLATPGDLGRYTLLQSMLRPQHWSDWLAATGTAGIDPSAGIMFASSTLAYQAAIDGLGIAMAQVAMVIDDLKSGRLVAPLRLIVVDRDSFHFTWKKESVSAKVRDFRDWMFDEAKEHNADVRCSTTDFERIPLPT